MNERFCRPPLHNIRSRGGNHNAIHETNTDRDRYLGSGDTVPMHSSSSRSSSDYPNHDGPQDHVVSFVGNPSLESNISSSCSLNSSGTPRNRKGKTIRTGSLSHFQLEVQDSNGHTSNIHKHEYFFSTPKCEPNIRDGSSYSNASPVILDAGGSPIMPEDVEPNVHHDDIMTDVVDCDVIDEMEENELFAREVGINFSKVGGDYLTTLDPDQCPQSDPHNLNLSPKYHLTPKFTDCEDDLPPNATFLKGSYENNVDDSNDLSQLRILAGYLNQQWTERALIAPTLARRIRDFQFAQEKRHEKFGNDRPWGILGLYEHLASVRMDVEWADEAAYRRANGEPYHAWFEFVESKKVGHNRPFFSYLSMAICSTFMLLSIALNGWEFEPVKSNPMIGPSADTLVAMGAKDSLLIVQENELWRIISSMVLHAGLIHFVINMLALWVIGSAVEQCHGFIPALVLFFVPAVGGTILSAIFLPDYISVGASGGIFGLIGACLADIVMNWQLLFSDFVNKGNKQRHIIILLCLFVDILVNSIIGFTPFVDNFTHLGGMVFGFLCGLSTMERVSTLSTGDRVSPEEIMPTKERMIVLNLARKVILHFFGVILSMGGLTISLALLLRGDGRTTPCRSCTVLSCVSFPPWTNHDNRWWYCDDCGSVEGQARMNANTGKFDQISIQCPGGMVAVMELTEDMDANKEWLQKKLPDFCRHKCHGNMQKK